MRIGRKRWQAFLLATLFVAGQAAAFVHLVEVSHVTCLDHGEVIHSGSATAEGGASVDRSAMSDAAEANAHTHDVCSIASFGRQRIVSVACATGSLPPAVTELSATALVKNPSSSKASLYQLAPKNSPPV